MQIDYCLITAAGLGTRMGEIGKRLPKPMWPFYCETLLDAQVAYVKRFNPTKIFINTFHQSKEIELWASKYESVEIIREDELLGSGGCVHNLVIQKDLKNGIMAVVNSDQFFMLGHSEIEQGLTKISEGFESVLYGMVVEKGQKYNETVSREGKLVEIRKPTHEKDYYTYSGVCLLDISRLKIVSGVTNFFETVCDYKNNPNIFFFESSKNIEFWDFGEKDKYVNNLQKGMKDTGQFKKFLQESGAFRECDMSFTNTAIKLPKYACEIDLVKKEIKILDITDSF